MTGKGHGVGWRLLLIVLGLTTAFWGAQLATSRAVSRASGAVYYVSPYGDDAHSGTLQSPWASPGFASRQLQPGDTLIILGGRYLLTRYDEDIVTPPSGRAGAPIVIRGEAGNRPVLAGGDNLAMLVNLSGVHYVRLENLELTHDDTASGEAAWARDGVLIVDEPASHIVLRDLYIHHLDEFGLNVQDVDDLLVTDCRIEYCGFGAAGGPEARQGGWRNVVIARSSLSWGGHYYQGSDGAQRPYDRPDGLGIEAGDGPVELVDVLAEHNYGDGLDSKTRRTTIRRCIVANNSCDGVKLWGGDSRVENTLIYGRGDGDPSRTPWAAVVIGTTEVNARFELVNVTVDDALGGNYLMYVQYDERDIPVRLTLQNTVWRGAGPQSHIYLDRATQLTALHNQFYLPQSELVLEHGPVTYDAASIHTLGQGNRYGDPLFVAPAWGAVGDYRLQAGSPAINAGLASGAPADDLEGRVRDAQPDIGSYEYGAVPAPTPTASLPCATATLRPPVGHVYLPIILKGLAPGAP